MMGNWEPAIQHHLFKLSEESMADLQNEFPEELIPTIIHGQKFTEIPILAVELSHTSNIVMTEHDLVNLGSLISMHGITKAGLPTKVTTLFFRLLIFSLYRKLKQTRHNELGYQRTQIIIS